MTHARLTPLNTLTRFVLGSADHWIIFDESYRALGHSSNAHHLVVSVASRVRSGTLIVNSISNSLVLTGSRIAYLGSPKVVIGTVNALRSHTRSQYHCTPCVAPPSPPNMGFARAVNICFWLIAVAHVVPNRLRTDRFSLLDGLLRLVEGRNGSGECDVHKPDRHPRRTATLRRRVCEWHKRKRWGPG